MLTAAFWNANVRDNSNALRDSIIRLGFQTRGTGGADNYSITQTLLASATDVFSADISFTADGTSSYLIEGYCPAITQGQSNQTVSAILVKGDGTSLGSVCDSFNSVGVSVVPFFFRYWYTPSAGTQTINLRGVRDAASNGTMRFGGGYAPGYIALYGPPTT